MKKINEKILVQSVKRAIMVLETVAKEKKGIGVTELSKRLGLFKSTTFRMLSTLEYYDYLTQDTETGKYHLGLKFMELSVTSINIFDLKKKSHVFLEELMTKTQESSYLVIMQKNEMFYLDWVECSQSLRMTAPDLGGHVDFHATALGKAIIAYLPDKKVEKLCEKDRLKAYTKQTITNMEKLKKELEQIRRQGYSIDDQERGDYSRCIAAPIRDYSGEVIAAVSISAPTQRLDLNDLNVIKKVSGFVIESAEKISHSFGFTSKAK